MLSPLYAKKLLAGKPEPFARIASEKIERNDAVT
jgi:hypothetical protein